MSQSRFRVVAVWLAISLSPWAADSPSPLTPDVKAALARISADSMRGNLSFLSSDVLEGRATPSRGLEVAAEFIASQYRRAGLEPLGGESYFQTAPFTSLEPNLDGLKFDITGRDPFRSADLRPENVAEVSLTDAAAVKAGAAEDVTGKVVFVYARDFRELMKLRRESREQRPALLVITGPVTARARSRSSLVPAGDRGKAVPVISVSDEKLASAIDTAAPGPLPFKVTAHIAAPMEKDVTLRNVVGILRGSDPALKDSYELITAHYDHLGIRAEGSGDRIYNGANDDCSGTVSLIEIAAALAGMNPRPRRSMIFAAFFGEEMGLLGSRYYGAHPVVPLRHTVAAINLEHMGRTDSDQGLHVGRVDFTGFDYSELPGIFRKAGEALDIQVVKDEKNSDSYFGRSDNQALADVGVPAHTVSVAYEFPDYHQPGDEWQKIDYDNMAKVDRMIALGLIMIGNADEPPRWNEHEPKAQKYVQAWKKLMQP